RKPFRAAAPADGRGPANLRSEARSHRLLAAQARRPASAATAGPARPGPPAARSFADRLRERELLAQARLLPHAAGHGQHHLARLPLPLVGPARGCASLLMLVADPGDHLGPRDPSCEALSES